MKTDFAIYAKVLNTFPLELTVIKDIKSDKIFAPGPDIKISREFIEEFPLTWLKIPIEINIVNLCKKNIIIWNATYESTNILTNKKDSSFLSLIKGNSFSKKINKRLGLLENNSPFNIPPEELIRCYGMISLEYHGRIGEQLKNIFENKKFSFSNNYKNWNPSLMRLCFLSKFNYNEFTKKAYIKLGYPILAKEFCNYEIKIIFNTADSVEREFKLDNMYYVHGEFKEKEKLNNNIDNGIWMSSERFLSSIDDTICLMEDYALTRFELEAIEKFK